MQYLNLRQGQRSTCGMLQKCRTLGCCDTWWLIIPVNVLHRPLCDSWKHHATPLCYNQQEPPVCVSTDRPLLLDHVPSPLQGALLFSDARPGSSDNSRILLLLWSCTDVCIHLALSKETHFRSLQTVLGWRCQNDGNNNAIGCSNTRGISGFTVTTYSKYCYLTRMLSHIACKTCLEGNLH
jgi:hypothetical protein